LSSIVMQRLVMLYLHVSCNTVPNRAISWNLSSYAEVNAFGFAAVSSFLLLLLLLWHVEVLRTSFGVRTMVLDNPSDMSSKLLRLWAGISLSVNANNIFSTRRTSKSAALDVVATIRIDLFLSPLWRLELAFSV